jgi:hypothetical protein
LSNQFKIGDENFFAHQSFLEFEKNHKFQRFAGNPYLKKKNTLTFLNVLEHFTNRLMLINFVKAFKSKGSELSLIQALGSFQAFLIIQI